MSDVITQCTHGMPTPKACVECMAEGPVVDPAPNSHQPLVVVRWSTARFSGLCGRCYGAIDPGDRIAAVEPIAAWVCEDCAS